jgi:hypothetical protein
LLPGYSPRAVIGFLLRMRDDLTSLLLARPDPAQSERKRSAASIVTSGYHIYAESGY